MQQTIRYQQTCNCKHAAAETRHVHTAEDGTVHFSTPPLLRCTSCGRAWRPVTGQVQAKSAPRSSFMNKEHPHKSAPGPVAQEDRAPDS